MRKKLSPKYIDEYKIGEVFITEPWQLSQEEIIEFATKYDPQPFHIDPIAAKEGPFGGLIASGFHTVAVAFRKFWDLGLFEGRSLGGPGADYVRWLAPIRPDESLILRITVKTLKISTSKPDRGYITMQFEILNESDQVACDCMLTAIILTSPK